MGAGNSAALRVVGKAWATARFKLQNNFYFGYILRYRNNDFYFIFQFYYFFFIFFFLQNPSFIKIRQVQSKLAYINIFFLRIRNLF